MWQWILDRFHDSETILWARLQMLVGAVFAVVSVSDVAPILNAVGLGEWVPFAVIVMGVVTETARRARADDV